MFKFLFWKKKKSKFEVLLRKFNLYLTKRKFGKALANYVELTKSYDRLDDEEKAKFDFEFSKIKLQMMLYLKTKELFILIKENNLEMIKDGLNSVFEIRSKVDGNSKLMEFVDKNYDYCLRVYNYKIAKNEFDEKLSDVYTLLGERFFDKALEEFNDLMFYFKEMEKCAVRSNRKLYIRLAELKKHIKMSLLENQAYSEEAKYTKVKKK